MDTPSYLVSKIPLLTSQKIFGTILPERDDDNSLNTPREKLYSIYIIYNIIDISKYR